MFEGHINHKAFGDERESDVLRKFRWTDLVARLAATRELRQELSKDHGGFEAFAEVRRECEEDGKRAGNHTGLNHGNDGDLNVNPAAKHAERGDRE